MKTLAIVVPCYNEEETIHPFLEACQAVERQMANQLAFNYYFVNDGSKDRTLEVLREVKLVWTPAWTIEKMSRYARIALGIR